MVEKVQLRAGGCGRAAFAPYTDIRNFYSIWIEKTTLLYAPEKLQNCYKKFFLFFLKKYLTNLNLYAIM